MITIQVKLYGTLRQYRPKSAGGAPHHPFSIQMDGGQSVAQLMEQLNIPSELTAVISVNGESAVAETCLKDNDQVSLFPPTAGGM